MSETPGHTACAVFTFKDQESKEKFIEFCNGDNGLSVTRGWKGCRSIDCYEAYDNDKKIVIWQKWDSKEAHESYVKHRHDDGSFDFLHTLIASKPEISALRPVVFKSDREQIKDVVGDMCDKDHTVTVTSSELMSINKLHVVGDMAHVCYTSHGKFTYKGTENDDVAVFTSVLQKVNGRWMVVHGQRSSGRTPGEPAPQFN